MHVIPGWFELISLAFCIGVLVCRLVVFPPSADGGSAHHEKLLGRIWRSFGIGIVAIFVCSIAGLMVRASEMSGQPISDVFSVLPTVLFKTHFGRAWLTRLATIIVLLISLKVFGRYRDSRIFLVFMLGLTVVISATESASGHASDAGDFSIPEITDWLHLLAASAWGGGLLVLSLFILPELIGSVEPQVLLIAGVARRFSRMAGFAVGIVAITALYNGLTYVGSFVALWKSPYGLTIIAKIVLFLILANLGGFNRYVSVPLLQEWAGTSSKRRGIFTRIAIRFFPQFGLNGSGHRIALRFRRSVRVEAFLIVAVLLCAALLRHEIPARHLSHMQHGGKGAVHQMHDGDSPPAHSDHNHQ